MLRSGRRDRRHHLRLSALSNARIGVAHDIDDLVYDASTWENDLVKVNINGANHQVEVECKETDLAEVVRIAKELWSETLPRVARMESSLGFQAEIRPSADLHPMDAEGR